MVAGGIEGFGGATYTFSIVNHAMLADSTSAGKERSFMMTFYDALIGLAGICSNLAQGYVIQLLGYSYPFAITTGILFIVPFLIAATIEDTWIPPKENSKTSAIKLFSNVFSLCADRKNDRPLCGEATID